MRWPQAAPPDVCARTRDFPAKGERTSPGLRTGAVWRLQSQAPRPENRYHRFSAVLRQEFGTRVHKVSIDAGFTCPNRDGSIARGGCTYCLDESLYPPGHVAKLSVAKQMERGMAYIARRHRASRFIAYFQTGTGTYDGPENLWRLYREALSLPGVVGLAVATRPDCVPESVLDIFSEIARTHYCWIELGLPSAVDAVLAATNRGHDVACFVDAVRRVKARGLSVCAHVILGLPGETRDQTLSSARLFNELSIDGIKIHNLHVIRGTVLERCYRAGKLRPMTLGEYAELAVDYLERLDPAIAIHRLTGETHRRLTVAPQWSVNKMGVLSAIHAKLEARNTWQGRLAGT